MTTIVIPEFPTWRFAMVQFAGQQSERSYLYANTACLDIAVGDRVRVQVRPPEGAIYQRRRMVEARITEVSNSRAISQFKGPLNGLCELLEPQVEIIAVSRLDGTGAGWYLKGPHHAPVGSVVMIQGGVMGSVVASRLMRSEGVGYATTLLEILHVIQSPCPPSVDPDPTEHDVRPTRERRERRHLPTSGDHREHIGPASGVPFRTVTFGGETFSVDDVQIEVVRSSDHAPVRNRRRKPAAPVEQTKTKRKFKL